MCDNLLYVLLLSMVLTRASKQRRHANHSRRLDLCWDLEAKLQANAAELPKMHALPKNQTVKTRYV